MQREGVTDALFQGQRLSWGMVRARAELSHRPALYAGFLIMSHWSRSSSQEEHIISLSLSLALLAERVHEINTLEEDQLIK
jgi:hypothetical protein